MNNLEADQSAIHSQKSESEPRVLVVACARDEAAYLPEWVFHYLRIGVAGIKVYINKTTDKSELILQRIGREHPVHYCIADELIETDNSEDFDPRTNSSFINGNPTQAKCYIDAYINCDPEQYTHIAFLDIDEFLLPENSLAELLINDHGDGSSITNIGWLNLTGEAEPFLPLSRVNHKGARDIYSKAIVRTGISDLRIEDPHTCSINNHTGELAAKACILHRVVRSKPEYIAILSRASTKHADILKNGFKKNRRGWTNKGKALGVSNARHFESYEKDLRDFISTTDLSDLLAEARSEILVTADRIRQQLDVLRQENMELIRVLGGTNIDHLPISRILFQKLAWRAIHLLSPSLVLNHIEIKKYFKGMYKRAWK